MKLLLKTALCLLLIWLPNLVYGLTFMVNSTDDLGDNALFNGTCEDINGNCTLRAALQEASLNAGPHLIQFNIPGVGPQTIQPATDLPFLSQPTTIDATTQAGYVPGGAPQIILDWKSRLIIV